MKNTNKILAARFTVDNVRLIEKIAKDRGMDVSDFIRFSVRRELARLSYLPDDEKKSLEVTGGSRSLEQ